MATSLPRCAVETAATSKGGSRRAICAVLKEVVTRNDKTGHPFVTGTELSITLRVVEGGGLVGVWGVGVWGCGWWGFEVCG